MLAVSVELSDPARVGKFVTPGSHIAIYQTLQDQGARGHARGEESQRQRRPRHERAARRRPRHRHGRRAARGAGQHVDRERASSRPPRRSSRPAASSSPSPSRPEDAPVTDPRHQQLHAVCRTARLRRQGRPAPRGHRPQAAEVGDAMTILWDADGRCRRQLPLRPRRGRRCSLDLRSHASAEPSRRTRRTRSSSSARTSTSTPPASSAERERVDRPELGVILLRHRLDVTRPGPGPPQRRSRGRRSRRPDRPRRRGAPQRAP